VIFVVIAAGYSVRTWNRNLDWRDDPTFVAANAQTSPASFKVHRELAMRLLNSDPAHSNLDRAVAEVDESLAILSGLPDEMSSSDAWRDAAIAYLAKADASPCSSGQTDWGCMARSTDQVYAEYERAAILATRAVEVESAGRAAFNRRRGTDLQPAAGSALNFSVLGRALLRIGKPEQGLQAALRARAIDPTIPQAYAEIAEANATEKHTGDAVLALTEGMFVTGNRDLREQLVRLYRAGADPLGCAVVPGPNGPALNPSCETVSRDFCAAALQVNRQDVIEQFSCRK
jgi:predicted Zn-dependent protease